MNIDTFRLCVLIEYLRCNILMVVKRKMGRRANLISLSTKVINRDNKYGSIRKSNTKNEPATCG